MDRKIHGFHVDVHQFIVGVGTGARLNAGQYRNPTQDYSGPKFLDSQLSYDQTH